MALSFKTSVFMERELSKSIFYKYGLSFSQPRFINSSGFQYNVNQSFKITKKTHTSHTYRKFLKPLGIGFGIGALGGVWYMYDAYKKLKSTIPMQQTSEQYHLQSPPPKQTLARSIFPLWTHGFLSFGLLISPPYPRKSRKIQSPTDRSGLKITLYQFQTCPFCCKVRAFLDYYGFSYDVVEVNSVTRTQTKWSSYRKVPFLLIQQQGVDSVMQLKDSSMITSALQSFISNKSKTLEDIVKGYPIVTAVNNEGEKKTEILNRYFLMYGEHPFGKSKEDIVYERKWRKWVDDVYVHMLSPNIYRTLDEAFQAFNWFSEVGNWEDVFSNWERRLVVYVGAPAMYLIGKRLKKRHHLKNDVRQSLYEETNMWLRELKQKGQFLGGYEPNLIDLNIFGVLTAIEGCDAFQDLLNNTKLEGWFKRMKNAVENHQGAKYLTERGPNIL